jgi:hypothetical protein
MILYLDLDGVFVDFDRFCQHNLGFVYQTNPEHAWSILDKIPSFFKYLEPINGSLDFFDKIMANAKCEVKVLTALPMLTGELISAPGDKRYWVHKFMDENMQVITVDSWEGKKAFAKGNVLLDDSRRNILDWEYHGGNGVWHVDKNYARSWEQLKKCKVV